LIIYLKETGFSIFDLIFIFDSSFELFLLSTYGTLELLITCIEIIISALWNYISLKMM